MNTVNNKRRQATRKNIESVFVELLQTRTIGQITVSDICKLAQINRSTFYANYVDVYDLADQIRDELEREVNALYDNDTCNNCGNDYLKLFRHVRDNQIIYKTYFKLGYDVRHEIDLGLLSQKNRMFPEDHMQYHIAFHRAGINAILKQWLSSGCAESPETMLTIIQDEYKNRH